MTTLPLNDREAVPNIFKILREASGLSHAKLAVLMRTSKHALIRLEQGLYDKPLPTALEFWLNEGRFLPGIKNSEIRLTELVLIDGYESFQEQTRQRSYHYFGPNLINLQYTGWAPHPLIQLENRAKELGLPYSEIGIAKALCVPQATLNLWKRKWRTQQTVPKTFQIALFAIGYSRFEVQRFNDGYIRWREANK